MKTFVCVYAPIFLFLLDSQDFKSYLNDIFAMRTHIFEEHFATNLQSGLRKCKFRDINFHNTKKLKCILNTEVKLEIY